MSLALALVSLGHSQPQPEPHQGNISPSGAFVPKPTTAKSDAENAEKDTSPPPPDGSGKIQWQGITIDTKARSIAIPAVVNQTTGIIEYALVHRDGKRHEALLFTSVSPQILHAAILLIGAKPAPLTAASSLTAIPPNASLTVSIEWDTNGPTAVHPLDSLVQRTPAPAAGNPQPSTPIPAGPWWFNGSQLNPGGFAAEADGSILALIADPRAVINNPRPERLRDDLHTPNAALLPKSGTPVRLIISLTPPAPAP